MQRAIKGGRKGDVHSKCQPLARLHATSKVVGISGTAHEHLRGPEQAVFSLNSHPVPVILRNCRGVEHAATGTATGLHSGTDDCEKRGRPATST